MDSLSALHGTGRDFLLVWRSLQDFWPGNISSAQYLKICVQSSFSHLYYFEEKSSLVLWQVSGAEKHWQPRWNQTREQGRHSSEYAASPWAAPGSPWAPQSHARVGCWGPWSGERPGKCREAKSNEQSMWNKISVMNHCLPIKKYPLNFFPQCSLTGILLPD